MAKAEISDYEEQRRANIAERDALLKKLALEAAGAGLAPKAQRASTNGARASGRKKPAVKKSKADDFAPRRTSSRLAGIEADSEKAKRKAEDDYQAQQEAVRIKRMRVSDDLQLKDIVVAGNDWEASQGFFAGVVQRGANPYERTFGDTEVQATTDKQLKALRERMSGLELYDGFEPNRIKITPERIYSLGFHPEPTKALVFAGDKLGNLGIFDASQTSGQKHASPSVKKEEDGMTNGHAKSIKDESQDDGDDQDGEDDDEDDALPAITTIHLHTRTISAFQFSPNNPSHLYTCSYDSSIRLMDLATSKATEVYGPADREADEPLSGVEVDPSSPATLFFSRLDGHVGRHDTREPPGQGTTLWELSEKKIGGFSIHPQYPQFLVTASLDRTTRLWDTRKIIRNRPALLGEHTSKLSVSHAGFNSVGQVATSSYDDTIKIWSFENMGSWTAGAALSEEAMEPTHVVKHNNQTGRWVTILRPQWQARPQDGMQKLVIGNMNRFVDVYSGDGQQLAQLGADTITAVPAVAQFHSTQNWIAAGTASGKLCLWM